MGRLPTGDHRRRGRSQGQSLGRRARGAPRLAVVAVARDVAAELDLHALHGRALAGHEDRVDVTEPFVLQDGQLAVPTGPGIGVDPIPEVLADLTVWSTELRLNA